MMASVNAPFFSITPTATFNPDDWLSNPNLWTVSISNTGDNKTVTRLYMDIYIRSAQYDPISDGTLQVVGPTGKYFIKELGPGQSFLVTNTMVQEGKDQMNQGDWSAEFRDESPRGNIFLTIFAQGLLC